MHTPRYPPPGLTLSAAPHAFTFQLYLGDYNHFFSSLPLPLKKRIKDMKRIFRNKIKKKLSFRLNSDVNHAIVLLREHHGAECWVGQELEEVGTEQHFFALHCPVQFNIERKYT